MAKLSLHNSKPCPTDAKPSLAHQRSAGAPATTNRSLLHGTAPQPSSTSSNRSVLSTMPPPPLSLDDAPASLRLSSDPMQGMCNNRDCYNLAYGHPFCQPCYLHFQKHKHPCGSDGCPKFTLQTLCRSCHRQKLAPCANVGCESLANYGRLCKLCYARYRATFTPCLKCCATMCPPQFERCSSCRKNPVITECTTPGCTQETLYARCKRCHRLTQGLTLCQTDGCPRVVNADRYKLCHVCNGYGLTKLRRLAIQRGGALPAPAWAKGELGGAGGAAVVAGASAPASAPAQKAFYRNTHYQHRKKPSTPAARAKRAGRSWRQRESSEVHV